ncbi:MAG: histidine kinase [Bacteroidota bacterium]
MRRLLLYWICQISGWTLYALVNIGLGAAYSGLTFQNVGLSLATSGLGIAGTHGLRDVALTRGWMVLPIWPLAVRMIGASLVTAFGMAMIAVAVFRVIEIPTPSWLLLFFGTAFNWTALVLLWSAIYSGFHLMERWRQAERDRAEADAERWRLEAVAREAELRALQAQVNPHFLFNSLNTVRALITENPDQARKAVTDLADLLRYALATERRDTVPLGDEIETVRRYLALERLRFEHRLDASVEADPDALAALVPPMVIQTLVENAIKHGIDHQPDGGPVRVRAAAREGTVRVTVDSPGRLDASSRSKDMGPEEAPEGGVGLANAMERLQRLCGDHASLTLAQATPDIVRAEVAIPLPEPVLT